MIWWDASLRKLCFLDVIFWFWACDVENKVIVNLLCHVLNLFVISNVKLIIFIEEIKSVHKTNRPNVSLFLFEGGHKPHHTVLRTACVFRPYFSLGVQYSLFIVAPRFAGVAAEVRGWSDTRRPGPGASWNEGFSVCARSWAMRVHFNSTSLIQSEFTEDTVRGRMRTNYVI